MSLTASQHRRARIGSRSSFTGVRAISKASVRRRVVQTGFVSPNETEFHFVAHTIQPDQNNFPPHTAWIHPWPLFFLLAVTILRSAVVGVWGHLGETRAGEEALELGHRVGLPLGELHEEH